MDAAPILSRLQILMDQHGINARQISNELGLSNSAFSEWKKGKGKPSLDAMVKFSEYFNISLDYLVLGKEFEEKPLPFFNSEDDELLEKFHSLTPDLRGRLLAYADGMLAAMSREKDRQEKLSV